MTPRQLCGYSIFILLLFSVITACGRRGDLDTPSQARNENSGEAVSGSTVPGEAAEPRKRFLLDPLIE